MACLRDRNRLLQSQKMEGMNPEYNENFNNCHVRRTPTITIEWNNIKIFFPKNLYYPYFCPFEVDVKFSKTLEKLSLIHRNYLPEKLITMLASKIQNLTMSWSKWDQSWKFWNLCLELILGNFKWGGRKSPLPSFEQNFHLLTRWCYDTSIQHLVYIFRILSSGFKHSLISSCNACYFPD